MVGCSTVLFGTVPIAVVWFAAYTSCYLSSLKLCFYLNPCLLRKAIILSDPCWAVPSLKQLNVVWDPYLMY